MTLPALLSVLSWEYAQGRVKNKWAVLTTSEATYYLACIGSASHRNCVLTVG